MAELITTSNYQDFSLDDLKTQEGVTRLNNLLRRVSEGVPSDGESVRVFQGIGTPEGSISAGVGSLYMRTDGTTDTAFYKKESGTGNTGWIASKTPPSLPLSIANGGTSQASALSAFNALCPSGFIVLWSGSSASIPTGWVLCNGSNSTPDLRDRFVIGAGSTYAVGGTGGATTNTPTVNSHTLTTTEMPAHNHPINITTKTGTMPTFNNTQIGTASASGNLNAGNNTVALTLNIAATSSNTGGDGGHSHTASSMSILNPYYALCFIMKT